MSKLREAAQAALEHWDKVSGIFRMTTETNRLRAALAQPETEAEPVMWMNRYDATMKTRDRVTANAMGFTIPLYTHPPRDEWRPASEPPEDGRDVVVWMNDGGHGCFAIGHCLRGEWTPNYVGSPVTHWRDVQPPTESTAKCQRIEGSGQICGLTPPCPDCGPSLIDVPEGS